MKEGRPSDILKKVKQERQEVYRWLLGAGVRVWEKSWGCGNTLDYTMTACVY